MSLKEAIASNAALEQIHKLKLSASRHFHAEVVELLLRIAPSSMSFTCIGVENARAYSYLRSVSERDGATLLPPRWTFRLSDLLPPSLPVRAAGAGGASPQPHELRASQLGPLFAPVDPEGRVLLVVLESNGVVCGVAGLERTASEPPFSRWELGEVGALMGALSLAATYVLTVEVLAYQEIAMRVCSGRSSLLMLADHQARQIIWASSSEQPLNWERDVLPQQRWLFDSPDARDARDASPPGGPATSGSAGTPRPNEIHELELDGCLCSVIRVPSLAEPPLSKREREVAKLLVGGYANLNIAAHLGISENTTRTYIRRLYKKLKVCNRIDLLRAYEAAS
jgi:DNA-binding CsgD family transcriptional regulator